MPKQGLFGMIGSSTKQAAQLGVLSASALGLSFVFQLYVFTQLGPGVETDALFAGMTIPQLVLMVISGSLMNVLVPLLAGENEGRLLRDAWAFLTLVGSLFGLIAVILYILAPWWVPLTVPGFNMAGKGLTVELTRIQLIGMVFAAINGVQWATYHARQQFVWAESTPILATGLSLVILIWALPRFGVVAAAWISTLRLVLQTILLAPGMGKPVRPNLTNTAVKQAWTRIKPLLLGTAYYKTDPLIDRFLLSSSTSGTLSLYYLAQQLYGAFAFILSRAICAPLVPLLSKLRKAGEIGELRRIYHRKLLAVAAISVASFLILIACGQSGLSLLVGHGGVRASNVSELYWIMIWLSGVLIGGSAGQVCSSSFYACGDTVTPTRMSVLTYTVYTPTKVLTFYLYGVMGLALSTSIYYVTNLLLQMWLLDRKLQI